MVFEPEVSIITGHITEIGKDYIYVWPGTRIMLMPTVTVPELSPGMTVTVRALRRHGQYIAESISVEPPSGGVATGSA